MTNKAKVPLYGAPQRFVTLEPGATDGATFGINLRWPDGRLVKAEDFAAPPDDDGGNVGPISQTLWGLVLQIPRNILEIAVLEGEGFSYRDADGSWRLRPIGRKVIDFAFGDASPSPIYVAPYPLLVVLCRVAIRTAFNGAGAELEIGTAAVPDLIHAASENDPATVGTYESTPTVVLDTGDVLQIAITPGAGASAGAGQLFLDTVPLEGI